MSKSNRPCTVAETPARIIDRDLRHFIEENACTLKISHAGTLVAFPHLYLHRRPPRAKDPSVIWLWLPLMLVVIGMAMLALFTAYAARKVELALPPSGAFADLSNARLHFTDCGEGPAILLIHGMAGNLRHFTYGVADRLAACYRVIAVDRPGCGYSTFAPGAPVSLQAQADIMAELLDKLQIDCAVIAGHSLGGAIALSLAQRHPQRVAALALVAPLTKLPSKASPPFDSLDISHNWLRKLLAWTFATPGTIALNKETMKLVFGPETTPKDFATRGGGLMTLRPSNFVSASTDLHSAPTSMPAIESAYAAMKVPVHVLYGTKDRILSHHANGEDFVDRLPGTQLTLVDGGHMLPITQPQATADFIHGAASFAFAWDNPIKRVS
ncbi:MAG: alpha/beta fold hydrolase [Burkholderiales bacterium]